METTAVCLSHEGVSVAPRPGHVADRPVWPHFGDGIEAEWKCQKRSQNPHTCDYAFRGRCREAWLHRVDDRHVSDQRGNDTGSDLDVFHLYICVVHS